MLRPSHYVPPDLAEKALNCHDLLTRWLPAQRGGALAGLTTAEGARLGSRFQISR